MFKGTEGVVQVYEPAYGTHVESRPYPAFAPSAKTMSQILLETAEAANTAIGARSAARENFGAAQYRRSVVDRIAALPVDESQTLVSISVQISDDGLAAMRRNPAYEEWVIGALGYDFAFKDPWSDLYGGSFVVHSFGAHKEDYRGESWFPGCMDGKGAQAYAKKSANSIWCRNTPKPITSNSRQYSDLAARLRMERMLRKLSLDRKHFQTAMLEQASKHRHAVEELHRTGKRHPDLSAPTPRFHGVSGAYRLALAGAVGRDNV